MVNIVIKKRVGLEFLGEEYKDSYLEFNSLSVGEYGKLLDDLQGVKDDGKKSVNLVLTILEERFLSGEFQGEQVSKDDLKQFDLETMTRCFELFTGQQPDPKV